MSNTVDINWSSKHGRAELQKIGNKVKMALPTSYVEQKKWAVNVVVEIKGQRALKTTSAKEFLHELRAPASSIRRPSLAIESLPAYIPDLKQETEVSSVAISRYDLTSVKVLALFNLGFVFFDAENRVLEEISSQYYPLLELNSNIMKVLDSCEHYPTTATFIADWFFERNYAHWLLDTIPRLLNRVGKVVCHKPEQQWQKALLSLYGIKESDIVPLEPNSCFSFDRLLMDGKSSCPVPHPSYKCHKGAIEFIRKPLCSLVQEGQSPLIALVIKRFDSRIVVNSHRLEDMLVKLGYVVQVIDCAAIPVAEQIRCFSAADVIIGAHGAAMANTVFCKPDSHILEIFPPSYGNPAFWAISNTVGAKYSAVTAVEEIDVVDKHARYRDIKLSENSFTLISNYLSVGK
ncbi:glycosyltransferase family 61 protein [Alteromonas stellipolaris]|uniref:glycosyltransferase family 61 protein n=1 Tax=Alteromonas stellipolaris TaxID=233316 RepID=UPI001DCD3866|nr:glycosyltransferase family 61 protein [Alteromonas stellipolaris]MBZ2163617.1 glycosyltransferase family 61 protein [Alteromonas stellipolaris]